MKFSGGIAPQHPRYQHPKKSTADVYENTVLFCGICGPKFTKL